MCNHTKFNTEAKVIRLTDPKDESKITDYIVEITVHCAECFKPFEWVGLPVGVRFTAPTTNTRKTKLRAPIKPAY